MALHQAGRLKEAGRIYGRVLRQMPGNVDAMHYLGVLRHQQGRSDEALELLRRSVDRNPSSAEFHNNLAVVLKDVGRTEDAVTHYRRALRIHPDYPEALNNLGALFLDAGALPEAEHHLVRALVAAPDYPAALSNLSTVRLNLGDTEQALMFARRAVELDPTLAGAQADLGNALAASGDLDAAVGAYQRAIALDPGSARCLANYGATVVRLGRDGEAVDLYRRALEIDPDNVDAQNNLGTVLTNLGQPSEALAHFERYLAQRPGWAWGHANLANALVDLGRFDDAAAAMARAESVVPGQAAIASNRLFYRMYDPDLDGAALCAGARAWAERFAAPLAGWSGGYANAPEPGRRLRVGYVSADFRAHAMAFITEPWLAAHDRAAVDLTLYAESAVDDAVTARFRDLADDWVPTAGLSDEALARRVQADGIDVLVDLGGHTAGHRLLVFARKPAPVQVSHLAALGQSTGLETMDGLLADSVIAPPGEEAVFSEPPLRIDGGFLVFRPEPYWPDVGPSPALAAGRVTFGSFNKTARLNDTVADLWSAVLERVPGARLLLKHGDLGDAGVRARLEALFGARGVLDRVTLEDLPDGWSRAMAEAYGRVDIALDTWPMTGGTTAAIALWMGLPVVTLTGSAPHTRFAASLLTGAGYADGITHTPEDYVARAAGLAADLDALAATRAGLRQRLAAAPLLDYRRLAAATEAHYRDLWSDWCRAAAARP